MATQATKADLVAALARADGKAEIGGEVVVMSPTGGLPSRAAAAIYRALWEYERRTRSGRAYGPLAERAMAAKRAEYFAAGTRVVGDVDVLREELARAYRPEAPDVAVVYRRGERAEAAPALPGWTFSVDDLFELPAALHDTLLRQLASSRVSDNCHPEVLR